MVCACLSLGVGKSMRCDMVVAITCSSTSLTLRAGGPDLVALDASYPVKPLTVGIHISLGGRRKQGMSGTCKSCTPSQTCVRKLVSFLGPCSRVQRIEFDPCTGNKVGHRFPGHQDCVFVPGVIVN